MDIAAIIESTILIVPVVLAFSNWFLSLFLARKTTNYFAVDLKQLWPDSLPFLKAQWPIVTIAMIAVSWSQLRPALESSNRPEFSLAVTVLDYGPIVITWILMLFYVSYLSEPKYPGRVATIGAGSLLVYVISDTMIVTVGALGLFFLLAPCLIVFVRSCLFLPIYAAHGHQPLSAIKRSWALTKDKYWLVSRYMGLPPLILISISISPVIVDNFWGLSGQAALQNCAPLIVATGAINLLLSLVIGGLLYKLYERLSAAENNRLNEQ
ncbi:hypothetical protein KA344_02380 [bacterium]|nr:hypothetical protein [bacterium]